MSPLPSAIAEGAEGTEVVEHQRVSIYELQGYLIYVGRNATSNEALVTDHKKEHPKCVWLHAVGQKGPHVVLCTNANGHGDLPVDPMVLRCAASKTIRHGNGTPNSPKRAIYAPLEDVYKPVKGLPGIFRTWRTTLIEV